LSPEEEEVPELGTYAQRERRYIVEWAEDRYPSARKMFNAPIGPIPESIIKEFGFERGRKLFRPWRLKIDCLVFLSDKLVAAEAEIWRPKEALRDLTYYMRILPETPDLGEWRMKPIEYVLVMPERIGWVEEQCRLLGIKLDVFKPAWIDKYVEMLGKYWTREGLLERMERKRRLGRL